MQSSSHRFSTPDRDTAFEELAAELAAFSHDGLVQLSEDLARHTVLRCTWDGCVISYRAGAAGSARSDHRGRPRNPFTILWDCGAITDEEVLACAAAELCRRRPSGVVPVL
jgi:hypothetical protein